MAGEARKAAERCLDCGGTEFEDDGDRNACPMPSGFLTMRVFHRFKSDENRAAAIRSISAGGKVDGMD